MELKFVKLKIRVVEFLLQDLWPEENYFWLKNLCVMHKKILKVCKNIKMDRSLMIVNKRNW